MPYNYFCKITWFNHKKIKWKFSFFHAFDYPSDNPLRYSFIIQFLLKLLRNNRGVEAITWLLYQILYNYISTFKGCVTVILNYATQQSSLSNLITAYNFKYTVNSQAQRTMILHAHMHKHAYIYIYICLYNLMAKLNLKIKTNI